MASMVQAQSNQQMAQEATRANRVNQYTPYGSLTYTDNGNGTWSQTESYSPEARAALDSQLRVQQGLSGQAESMLDRVRNSYSQPFNAPSFDSYLANVGAVDQSSVGRAGTFGSNAQVQNSINTAGVNGVDQSKIDASGVNVNAPQFAKDRQDQYSKAAYDASYGLLKGDMDAQEQQLSNRLALQGLAPMTDAASTAMGSYYDGRSRQLNALANQAVLTGNSMSNQDYASQLAGFNAGNAAVGQQFNQNVTSQAAQNAAQAQAFGQAKDQGTFANSAAAQQFAQDQSTYQNNLSGLTTNAALQQAQNQAQQQAYNQAVQNYGTNWQQAQTLRNMPLNELNALLYGQQVTNPTFENYALQGTAQGVNALGALAAANAAQNGGGGGMAAAGNMVGSLFGAAGQAGGFSNLFSFSDVRLKENVHKISETEDGTGIYSWQWNKEAKRIGADKAPNVGVLAQENLDKSIVVPSGKGRGYLMVDYSRIH